MGAENILTFIREIGIFGKENNLAKMKKLAKIKKYAKNWSKDTLPMDVWKLILEEKGETTWREIYKRMGRSSTHNIHVNKRQLKRETLREIALAMNSKRLLNLAESDLYWDKIVSIKSSGVKQVYDLTIDKTHNFIANDIVVHNTSLAMNIAQYVAVELKRPVGFFSLEMSREELVDRLLIAQADIDAWKLKTGKLSEDDFTKLSNAMGVLAEAPLFIDDTPALSILEMRTKARRLQVENGLDLLIVDYLQLARSRNLENRVQEVSEISQGLKNLAGELKIPVFALSQLSRAVETRGGKKPQLSDLRDSGCLTGETLITLADSGKQVRIDSLVGKKDFNVFSLDAKLNLVKSKVSRVFPSGKKLVFRLVLKSGRESHASGNHKFLKIEGWQRLDRLKIGDRIAVPRILEVKGASAISDDRLILLAHLIGDGCYVKRQPLHYTNSEMKLIDIVKNSALKEFNIKPRLIKQNNWYHLYLAANEKLARERRNPIVKWLDEDLHVYGQHSRVKVLPEQIFELSDSKIKLFLKHLWATDGCIFTQEGNSRSKVSIYYASGSKVLAMQVQHLLLRLGILSTIGVSKKEGHEDMFNVQIMGKTEQMKFLKNIGSVGNKVLRIKKALEFLSKIKENPNNDMIPKDIWKLIKNIFKEKGISTREFQKMLGWSYSGTQRYKNGIGRERLIKIYRVLEDGYLGNLAKSDIYWDEIKSIEKVGKRQVYDATVPGGENFVANDIIVHNSIEQDADVVMFLWREDDDNVENMMLDIAKHRNGPLRSVPFYFKGDRIRFYSRDSKHKV